MMTSGAEIRWLRAAYWTGAVCDALTLVPMLAPSVAVQVYGLGDFSPRPEYRYAIGLAAGLMLGWTILLLWADRRPLERRGVLPITGVVVLALAAAGAYAVAAGFIAFERMLPTWIWQGIISALFLTAYARSGSKALPRH